MKVGVEESDDYDGLYVEEVSGRTTKIGKEDIHA